MRNSEMMRGADLTSAHNKLFGSYSPFSIPFVLSFILLLAAPCARLTNLPSLGSFLLYYILLFTLPLAGLTNLLSLSWFFLYYP